MRNPFQSIGMAFESSGHHDELQSLLSIDCMRITYIYRHTVKDAH